MPRKRHKPEEIVAKLRQVVAAADESRDELVDLWARLPAAAADPTRTTKFRRIFIEIAKQMDPIDAVVLQAVAKWPSPKSHNERVAMPRVIAESLKLTDDEFEVSRTHLVAMGLFSQSDMGSRMGPTSLSREFLRAVND